MHDNMVDILIYLYETYLDGEQPPPQDQEALEEELSRVGFSHGEIVKALNWLDELAMRAETAPHHPYAERSIRCYSMPELAKLDLEARGFLLSLEQSGILDPATRELVIDRVLAIDHPHVLVEEIKWVVLLVLMNQPGREDAFSQMEDLIYNTESVVFH